MNGNRCENLHTILVWLRVRFSGFLGQGSLLDLLTVLTGRAHIVGLSILRHRSYFDYISAA